MTRSYGAAGGRSWSSPPFRTGASAGCAGLTGRLVGSSEVWLEPWGDGTLLHCYLRADLTGPGSATEVRCGRPARLARLARAEGHRHGRHVKRCVNALKDELE